MLHCPTFIITADGFIHNGRRRCPDLAVAALGAEFAVTDSDTLGEAIRSGGLPCPYCC